MSAYKIAWLPGDGVGNEVMEAARITLDALKLDAVYTHGDIGWEFWCTEGESFPQRTDRPPEGLRRRRCSGPSPPSPVKAAEQELVPELKGKGLTYRSPIVRMRQMFDLYICLRPCKAYPGNPLNFKETIDLVIFRENTEDLYAGVEFSPVPDALADDAQRAQQAVRALRRAAGRRATPSPARSTRGRAPSGSSAPPSSSPGSSAGRR